MYSVLVVDDDEDDLMLLEHHLRSCHQDIQLSKASNGEQVTRQLLDGLHPNLIIIDANMPIMNGHELVVWLMKSIAWRHLPIIVWTGEMTQEEVMRYYRAGANSVMLKRDALAGIDSFCHHWFKLVQLPPAIFNQN